MNATHPDSLQVSISRRNPDIFLRARAVRDSHAACNVSKVFCLMCVCRNVGAGQAKVKTEEQVRRACRTEQVVRLADRGS